MHENRWAWAAALCAVLAGCGSNDRLTKWLDEYEREGRAPVGGEDSALLMDFPAGTKLNGVTYSGSDADLVLVRFDFATGSSATSYASYYVIRLSTHTATPYCGQIPILAPYLPIEPDVSTAAFGLVGDDLVFFAPVVHSAAYDARVVCSKGAGGGDLGTLVSEVAIPSPYVSNGPSALMRANSSNGFWTTGRNGSGAAAMEVRFDGTLDVIPFTSNLDSGHKFDLARNAFYFVASGDVMKIDLGTRAIAPVATGIGALSIFAANEHGLMVSTSTGSRVLTFPSGSTYIAAAFGTGPADELLTYFESDGTGFIAGRSNRFDLATGTASTLTLAPDLQPIALQYRSAFTWNGFAYLLGPMTNPLDLWVVPTSSLPTTTFSRGSPTYRLQIYEPDPTLPTQGLFDANPVFYAFADESCLVFTDHNGSGATPSVPEDSGLKALDSDREHAGEVWPLIGGRAVTWTRCGSTSATVLASASSGRNQGYQSWRLGGESARMDAPYFTQGYLRVRTEQDVDRITEVGAGWWDFLESGWTVKPTGEVVPLFHLADDAYLRPSTLANFVVVRDSKLYVAKGYTP